MSRLCDCVTVRRMFVAWVPVLQTLSSTFDRQIALVLFCVLRESASVNRKRQNILVAAAFLDIDCVRYHEMPRRGVQVRASRERALCTG